MANNFNNNWNKKNLNGETISHTTHVTNYTNDTCMRNHDGVPTFGEGGSSYNGLHYVYNDCLFVEEELSTSGGVMNGVYYQSGSGYYLIDVPYTYSEGSGGSGEDVVSFECQRTTIELEIYSPTILQNSANEKGDALEG